MKTIAQENLLQLRELLTAISVNEYQMPISILSNASIGEHMRHILEFYLLLITGSFQDKICYDKRERNKEIETEPLKAISTIDNLIEGISLQDINQEIAFEGDFTQSGDSKQHVLSSIGRELAYCIEHSIHHQAMIKAGLIALGLEHLATQNFGVAYSTIRYRNTLNAK